MSTDMNVRIEPVRSEPQAGAVDMGTARPQSRRSGSFGACLLAASLMILALPAWAQWPMGVPATGDAEVTAIANASNGDTIVAGQYSGLLEYGGASLASEGLEDIFIARVRPGGQVVWVRRAGGPSVDTVRAISLDAANNVFIVGGFFGTARFGGSDLGTPGATDRDGYVAKLDFDGSWRWARQMGGSGNDEASGAATLPGDNTQIPPVTESVAITGRYVCNAAFGSLTLNAPNAPNCPEGSSDLFVARLSTNGDWLWARNRGGAASGSDRATHMLSDADNRLFVIGQGAGAALTTLISSNFNDGLLGAGRPRMQPGRSQPQQRPPGCSGALFVLQQQPTLVLRGAASTSLARYSTPAGLMRSRFRWT
jgi:hypothetical protein